MAGTKMSDAAKAALVIEHEGEEYILSPLEIGDLADAQRWAEEKPFTAMARRMDILGERCTPAMKERMYDEAVKQSALVSDSSEGMGTVLASMEGVIYLLYLSLRHKHPIMTVKAAEAMVDIATLGEWQNRLDRVSGFNEPDEETPGSDPPPQSAPTTVTSSA